MIVFIGDLHGNPAALKRVALGLKLTDSDMNWKAADVSLVIAGDVCDRGTDSASIYRTIMKWQEDAPAFGSELIFLIGNHEVMNICGQYYYNTPEETASYADSAEESGEDAKAAAFSPGGWLFEWLCMQQFIVKRGPFIAAHADFSSEFRNEDIESLEKESRRLFTLAAEGLSCRDELLWCREANSGRDVYGEALGFFLEANGADCWVCGHTPAMDGKIRRGYSGRYICVDTAMGFRLNNVSALIYKDGETNAVYPDGPVDMVFTDPVDF